MSSSTRATSSTVHPGVSDGPRPTRLPTPGNTVHDTADMIVTVAGALMRSALRPLLTAPGKTEADADSVLRRTCLLFREVTRP